MSSLICSAPSSPRMSKAYKYGLSKEWEASHHENIITEDHQ